MLAATAEAAPETAGPGRRHLIVLGVLVAVVALFYAGYSLIRFWDFHATAYDLVIFDQGVRSYSHFHLPTAIIKGVHNGFGSHFTILGDHFSPILAVLAPLYWIHDGPQNLLVAQGVLLALTILPLWAYARRRLGVWQAYCAAGVYALAWPVAQTVAFDFHELAFVPVLSMLMLERHDAGRRWQSAAAAVALLLVKEDMGLLIAGFGLYLLTRSGERWRAAVFIGTGLAWTWLASRVLIPAFGGAPDYYWAYNALGRDLPQAALHAVTHPWAAVKLLVTPDVKATTMLLLVAPLIFLPLASPITLAVLPLLAERMLASSFALWWEPKFHYNAALIALLVAAGVDGAARLRRLGFGPVTVARAWPILALAATVATVPYFSFKRVAEPSFYRRDAHAQAAAAVARGVPDGALVEAPNSVGPWLSGRARVLLLDRRPRLAPWVIVDTEVATFPISSAAAQHGRERGLLRMGYKVVREEDGLVLLNRPGSVPDLRPLK
jgi:uncharacterized membrane protein